MQASRVVGQRGFGAVAFGASLSILDSAIEDTGADGALGGDGASFGFGVDAFARLQRTRIESSARAAVSNFGAFVQLSSIRATCQPFDLDAEPVGEKQAVFDNVGDNLCGCPAAEDACQAQSANLAPPMPEQPGQ
jgi:hypothetical protein